MAVVHVLLVNLHKSICEFIQFPIKVFEGLLRVHNVLILYRKIEYHIVLVCGGRACQNPNYV